MVIWLVSILYWRIFSPLPPPCNTILRPFIFKKLTFCDILQTKKNVQFYHVRRIEEKARQVFIDTVRANKEMHNKEDC